MRLRTKGEQKAYLDGYEMCADCIEKYLTDEGKQKLECLLMSVRNAVKIEDIAKNGGEDWYDVASDEMTLEQARQAVKDLRKKLAGYLDQDPCGDAISRQKAIDAIDALYLDGDSSASYLANAEGDTLIGKYQAITALDDL